MATIIKKGLVVLESEAKQQDIRIDNGRFAEIADHIIPSSEDTVIDAQGKIVLPGAIDSHVHFHMPTATGYNADDFLSGSACAAVSGTTTVVDFASPIENKTLGEALQVRIDEALEGCHVDFAMHMEITGDFYIDLDQLAQLKEMGLKVLKIYTTYGSSEFPAERLGELFKKASELDLITLVHAEENSIILKTREEFQQTGKTAAKYHGDSRPISAEVEAIKRIIALAKEADAKIIIAHISSGAGAQLVAEAREQGLKVSGETCPHYLLLTDECYRRENPQFYIMTPPLRKKEDNDILWNLVQKGMIATISTDHCPFTVEEKLSREGCFEAIPGIGGCETLVPLLFSFGYSEGRLNLNQLADLLSTNAAKLYGLYPQKGVIAEGSDADVVIVDPSVEYTIQAKNYPSKAGYSVYEGTKVKGKPVLTMIRGNVVAKDGVMVAPPQGHFLPCKN